MHGGGAPVAPVAASELEAKLGLVEVLLASTDLQASARRVVDWLVAQTSIRSAVVALSEPSSSQLLIVAERGISSAAIVDFVLTHEDEAHPLIKAMHRKVPSYFDGQQTFRSPFEGRFHAVPLRSDDSEPPLGLLLAGPSAPEIRPEVTWVATMLSRQASRLLSRDALAETRFGQERMLLYSIINAVTDPILLTDTEGKLIIANTHAEKLFAAPEDASEGWRRAVGLNNMLFSAALSTSAVSESELARRELLLVDPLEGFRFAVRASQFTGEGRTAGHLRGLGPAQRHRSRPREGRDRRELSHACVSRRRRSATSAIGSS